MSPLVLDLRWDRQVLQEELEDYWRFPKPPRCLYRLQGALEEQYRGAAWPTKLKHIVIYTEVRGGSGDISAAAKVIRLMQRICPTLTFDWIAPTSQDVRTFLPNVDQSKVRILQRGNDVRPSDFLVTGPVKSSGNRSPMLNFWEIGTDDDPFKALVHSARQRVQKCTQECTQDCTQECTNQARYSEMHKIIFSTGHAQCAKVLGLEEGSGVFIDLSLFQAPLSRRFSCPSYLFKLEDQTLKRAIFDSMPCHEPNYDRVSLNFGYAHSDQSMANFIDFVAIHERQKQLVIVFHRTEGDTSTLFSQQRVAFLEKWGYGSIIAKQIGKEPVELLRSTRLDLRTLTALFVPSVAPNDMRQLQLASERLLATGDNSPAEAWAARCKLFMYEIFGLKRAFHKQQVQLASRISDNLGKFFELSSMPSLKCDEMEQVIQILLDEKLSEATLEFCRRVCLDFSLEPILEGALKRTAWLHCQPNLIDEEVALIEEEAKSAMVHLLQRADAPPQTLTLRNLSQLRSRITSAG